LSLELGQDTCIKFFHQTPCANVVSAAKLLMQARGPVWHRKQQKPGIIPAGLSGLATEAPWRSSQSEGWVYGHGTFGMVAWTSRLLGACKWMRHSANEAKRRWLETGKLQGLIPTGLMASKADEKDVFRELRRQRGMRRLTTPRKGAAKSPERQRMRKVLKQKNHQQLSTQRSDTVEPMPGLVKDIFALETCWRRGRAQNRWLFAAMGGVIQMHP
jgi:hypothetical protein